MSKEFKYSYSAPTEKERVEIEQIKSRYQLSSSNEKLVRLKKLDSKVKNTPTIVSLILGIVGVLVFGTGLTMALEWNLLLWGAVVSLVGCVPITLAYFVYNAIYEKLKTKYAHEIIELSNELLKDDDKK